MTSLLDRASIVFHEICDLEPAEQRRRLEELEGSDPPLRAKVEELLQADRTPDARLEGRALDLLSSAPSANPLGAETLAWLERLARRTRGADQYKMRGEIARGGMGTVFEVWDEDLERTLAMKCLGSTSSESGADAAQTARFLNEARITGQLDHPGIVPVHELGLDGHGRPYFTMKRVAGHTLTQVFELVHVGKDGWTLRRVLGVFLRLCETMAFAHARGVIHRDLKPGNVMVGGFGEVYVMDWGIAKTLGKASVEGHATDQAPSPASTAVGGVLGTAYYMPPEQAVGNGGNLGPHSDVYAVGAMLYDLLARHPPYREPGETSRAQEVVARLRSGPPPRLHLLDPKAPRELVAITEKAMARDWSARYATMTDLGSDLTAYLEGRPGSAWRDDPLRKLVKFIRRRPTLFATSVALVLISLLAVILRQETELGAERARMAAALTEKVRVQDEQLWDDRLIRSLSELRGSDGRYVRSGSDQDHVSWARDYSRALAGLEVPLPPATTEAQFERRYRLLAQRRADQAERILRALYQLAFRLSSSGASFADLVRRGLAVPAHPRISDKDWKARVAAGLENMRKAPDMDAMWSPLCSLLARLDDNDARRRAFQAWQDWNVERTDTLTVEASSFDGPDDLLWFAKIVTYIRGPAASRSAYERAVSIDPSSFWAQFELAGACYQSKTRAGIALALEHARNATVLDPHSAWAFTNVGVYAIELAAEHLKAAKAADSGLATYLSTETERLRSLAVASYERAIELNPNISVAYSNLANSTTDPERQETLYRRAVALEPCVRSTQTSARANLLKGERYAGLVEIMEEALACDPSAEHHWWLAEALYDLGCAQAGKDAVECLDRAAGELEQARRDASDNTDILVLGLLIEGRRAEKDAMLRRLADLLDGLEKQPNKDLLSSLIYYQGRLEAALRQADQGADLLEQLHAILPR